MKDHVDKSRGINPGQSDNWVMTKTWVDEEEISLWGKFECGPDPEPNGACILPGTTKTTVGSTWSYTTLKVMSRLKKL